MAARNNNARGSGGGGGGGGGGGSGGGGGGGGGLSALCCVICKIVCCPPCPSYITAKLSFFPPSPPSYELEGLDMLLVDPDTQHKTLFTPPGQLHILNLRSRRGNNVKAFYHEIPQAKYTLLYSHGNAVDIGQMAVYLASLSVELRCSIFAYDYAGYGQGSGRLAEANLYSDIEASWQCLRTQFGVPADKIILYGQSIGTVATVDFASRLSRGRIAHDVLCAGVILHSPLMSGLRVLRPKVQRTWCFDPFPSIDKIGYIGCPILIVHGLKDEVVHVSHGYALLDQCRDAVSPLFLANAGHNDIEFFPEFRPRLRRFLEELTTRKAAASSVA